MNPRPHPYQGCALPLSYTSNLTLSCPSFLPTKEPRPVSNSDRARHPCQGVGKSGRDSNKAVTSVKKNIAQFSIIGNSLIFNEKYRDRPIFPCFLQGVFFKQIPHPGRRTPEIRTPASLTPFRRPRFVAAVEVEAPLSLCPLNANESPKRPPHPHSLLHTILLGLNSISTHPLHTRPSPVNDSLNQNDHPPAPSA